LQLLLIQFYIRSILSSRYVRKTIWVLNNFLTMECYRKLCNRLYWKKFEPGTLPYTTRCWLIILSVLSAIWLAFFFDPMDPTNSNSPSRIVILLSKVFRKVEFLVYNLIINFGKASALIMTFLDDFISEAENVFLRRSRHAYIRTSSLLI
jgi:hypothetical protein